MPFTYSPIRDEVLAMFPVFDPRSTDLVLGLIIGLSFAMTWHCVALALLR